MEFVNDLSGMSPIIKKYQASATLGTAGVPITNAGVATSNVGSVVILGQTGALSTTTAIAGLTADTTSTISAPGNTVATADIVVSVIINPNAVYRAKLSGGATADTALSTITATVSSSSAAAVPGTTTLDDGIVWGHRGNNVGEYRRADDPSGSLSHAFPNAVTTSDLYVTLPGFPLSTFNGVTAWFDLTSDSSQVDASASAGSATDSFVIVDVELNDHTNSGLTNSYYHLVPNGHVLNSNLMT